MFYVMFYVMKSDFSAHTFNTTCVHSLYKQAHLYPHLTK